ncbi:MAG: 2OG-Fe(II) oxygenase [Spirosomataceae bacterium]
MMIPIDQRIAMMDWPNLSASMHQKGYALVPRLLTNEECCELIENYENTALYRKKVVMERHRFGLGEYQYFKYPLPPLLQSIREKMYPFLSEIANTWMNVLKIKTDFPSRFSDFQDQCHAQDQTKPTVLILKYGSGGHNTLHQDLYGEVFFPIQVVLFLNEPEEDYTGGEFVLTQQTPRAQSKAIVLTPQKGDMLLFTTSFRPVKGSKGYYRVQMKHGVSEVLSGNRYTLGIIFHDALS